MDQMMMFKPGFIIRNFLLIQQTGS